MLCALPSLTVGAEVTVWVSGTQIRPVPPEQCWRDADPKVLPYFVPSALSRVSCCQQHLPAQERAVPSQLAFSAGLDFLPCSLCAPQPEAGDGRENTCLFIA